MLALKVRADCGEMLTNLFKSLVLSMPPRPIKVFVMSEALSFKLRAVCAEMLAGLFKLLALPTFPKTNKKLCHIRCWP